jgi:hypothetical protein
MVFIILFVLIISSPIQTYRLHDVFVEMKKQEWIFVLQDEGRDGHFPLGKSGRMLLTKQGKMV